MSHLSLAVAIGSAFEYTAFILFSGSFASPYQSMSALSFLKTAFRASGLRLFDLSQAFGDVSHYLSYESEAGLLESDFQQIERGNKNRIELGVNDLARLAKITIVTVAGVSRNDHVWSALTE